VLISLLSISWIGKHSFLALSLAIFGGLVIGIFITLFGKFKGQASGSWALWVEPAIVLLFSPALLFPSQERLIFFPGIFIVFFFHFIIRKRFVELNPALIPVALLLIMVLVSIYATYDIQQSLPKVAGVLLGAMAFISISNSALSRHQVIVIIAAFIFGGVGLAGMGLIGTQWISKFPYIGKITSHLPVIIKGLKGAEEGFQPNAIAGSLILFVPLQIALVYRFLRHGFAYRYMKAVFAILLASLLITGGVIILTQSRGGWLGLAMGLLILLAWSSYPGKWISGIAFILGTAAMLWIGPKKVGDFMISAIGGTSGIGGSLQGRIEVWSRAIYGIADFPFTGMGMNTFRKVVHVLYPLFLVAPDTDIAHCHNQLLQTALDLGIPGLVAYVMLLSTGITMGLFIWRRSQDPWFRSIAQGLVCGIIAQQVFGITDAIALGAKFGIFFWVALGILAAMFCLTKQEMTEQKKMPA